MKLVFLCLSFLLFVIIQAQEERKGCDNNMYGENCLLPCGHCLSNKCDNVTGECDQQRCHTGYSGQRCDQPCPRFRYGQRCHSKCSPYCEDPGDCVSVTGECTHGCKAGFKGYYCSQVCSRFKYGQNCNQDCSANCKHPGECDSNKGKCIHGCKAGYHGDTCTSACPLGTYGLQCQENCDTCVNSDCESVNGNCTQGCVAGYMGTECRTLCPRGKYGHDCRFSCSTNCHAPGDCDSKTGKCNQGCKAGYHGDTCSEDSLNLSHTIITTILIIAFLASTSIAIACYINNKILKKRLTQVTQSDVQFNAAVADYEYEEIGPVVQSEDAAQDDEDVSHQVPVPENEYEQLDGFHYDDIGNLKPQLDLPVQVQIQGPEYLQILPNV